ncbi:hypothetical protein [Microbacterium sp. YY-01]|uniref:hypothetical protein n=1 Tax=Microbacterium sp. YY-01 TaxID=3421634 RepID=UPI003D17104C
MTTLTAGPADDFTTGEGLRHVLTRLHQRGPGAWQHDPIAGQLMAHAACKYAALARRHGLDPWEAASAAFEVMRMASTRRANDPWGVVTRAVQITCIAEERGQGLLCSTNKARRPHISELHDPERISDRETPLSDYHPAFRVTDRHQDDLDDEPAEGVPGVVTPQATARAAIADAVQLFVLLGWPKTAAQVTIDRVCETTERAGTRANAYEILRHDKQAPILLDLPAESWKAVVRVLLGNTQAALQASTAGRGLLMRLLLGDTVHSLLHDDELVFQIALAAPGRKG